MNIWVVIALHFIVDLNRALEQHQESENGLYICSRIMLIVRIIKLINEKYTPTKKLPTHLTPFNFFMYQCSEDGIGRSSATQAITNYRNYFLSDWVSLQLEKNNVNNTSHLFESFCKQFTHSALNPDVVARAAGNNADAYITAKKTLLKLFNKILKDLDRTPPPTI